VGLYEVFSTPLQHISEFPGTRSETATVLYADFMAFLYKKFNNTSFQDGKELIHELANSVRPPISWISLILIATEIAIQRSSKATGLDIHHMLASIGLLAAKQSVP
jgi:hypothetical protein